MGPAPISRPRNENILTRWIIDAACWRRFQTAIEPVRKYRDRIYVFMEAPEPFPDRGIEVRICDDGFFVGDHCVHKYVPEYGTRSFVVRDAWLEVNIGDENDDRMYLLPLPRSALADVRRVTDALAAPGLEADRIQAEQDARPTFLNRLRRWIEAHFVITLLGFFFVLLPLFIFALHLLSVAFPNLFPE